MDFALPVGTIRVVAAVVVEEGRLLIAKRRKDARRGGLWELPGGKVEEGETDEQALARELKEELGVDASVGELFGRVVHAYSDLCIELLAYRCRIAGTPLPLHSDAVDWAPTESLADYDFPAADAPFIERLIAGLYGP